MMRFDCKKLIKCNTDKYPDLDKNSLYKIGLISNNGTLRIYNMHGEFDQLDFEEATDAEIIDWNQKQNVKGKNMILFKKEYKGEDLTGFESDIHEAAFDEIANVKLQDIPHDDDYNRTGTFIVTLEWKSS
jgi:hypothetical protein